MIAWHEVPGICREAAIQNSPGPKAFGPGYGRREERPESGDRRKCVQGLAC